MTLVLGPPFGQLLGREQLTLDLDADSCDVRSVLDELQKANPEFRHRLVESRLISNGRLMAVIVLDGQLASLGSPVQAHSEIKVLCSMSGG